MLREPSATYRLQLHAGFGFLQAAEVATYLSELGISHVYTSPYLQAAIGSTHGYDVVDHSRVNVELGGTEAHAQFCQALQELSLGQMIDVVPNHMAISGQQNPWWWDVLKNGPSSKYATYFDVDWESSEERWPNKVLLPVLEDHYGRILDRGMLRVSHNRGIFNLHYQEFIFPIDSSSLVEVLSRTAKACGSELLDFLAESHARLPRPTVTSSKARELRHRDKSILLNLLARLCLEEPEISAAINSEVERLNSDPNALDTLIERQNYRLAFWKTASRDLGYRRFFDIKDLAGLRVEDMEVFRAIHALPITWMQKGWIQALRIDHPDGLRDPTEYFCRLRETFPEAWIVAEKILEPNEKIPPGWPIAGTTGYDFLNLVGNLCIDAEGMQPLTHIYENFINEKKEPFHSILSTCKRLVLKELLGSELNRLSSLFVDICERHRRHRDYTRHDLHEALLETAIFFPVYRSYMSISRNLVRQEDEEYISRAIQAAMEARDDLDAELFNFLKDLLLLRVAGELEGELAMRFQQLTGPAMAKGMEDTALYRYNRLIALNEVGGDPSLSGISLSSFHQACETVQAERSLTMSASTTHDTKRSEDVRARLSLLSEIPKSWQATVTRWSDHNERYRCGNQPDRNSEYFLYQTLVGAWPLDIERATTYMQKAAREAKLHTSWTHPNEIYEQSLREFIISIMGDKIFQEDLKNFVDSLLHPGWINSLAQTLIKLTAPGIPDIYQGSELWNLSLVDPDNRKPVDFALRRTLLAELNRLSPEAILARLSEGLPKLWIIRQSLHLRNERPEMFGPKSTYRPLFAEGAKAEHLVAFVRGEGAITITPRLSMRLAGDWAKTTVQLPSGSWHNLLSGEEVDINMAPVPVQELLAHFPVGLLVKNGS